MGTALERAFASIFIIVLGYFLKRVGLFGKDDYDVAAKICMNVTLPAAIITGFGSYEQDYSLFIVVLLGALCNAAMIAAQGYYQYIAGHTAGLELNGLPTLPIDYE